MLFLKVIFIFEKIKAIAKITLNHPERYNSIVKEMALQLQKKLDRIMGLGAQIPHLGVTV